MTQKDVSGKFRNLGLSQSFTISDQFWIEYQHFHSLVSLGQSLHLNFDSYFFVLYYMCYCYCFCELIDHPYHGVTKAIED